MRKDKNYRNSEKEDNTLTSEIERPETGFIYLVKNPSSNELSVCASPCALKKGTAVIAPTRYGLDYQIVVGSAMSLGQYAPGSLQCQGPCHHGTSCACKEEKEGASISYNTTDSISEGPVDVSGEIDWIDHIATEEEIRRYTEMGNMEEEALILCREKVHIHNLDMKLVSAHYLFGEPKIIFFFTAANRVDFRDLVKDLVSVFRIRIELRQIGVRDESRVLGGLAVCGRDFCCHCITDKINPVSIKMAKEQNLSLNSTKISGPCGRLLCCLSYEYDFYVEEKQHLPPEGSRLKVNHELMKITEVNILSRKISLISSDGRMLMIPFSALLYNDAVSRWEITREYLDEFLSN